MPKIQHFNSRNGINNFNYFVMKELLIENGFIKWLNDLQIAPYAVMFFDLPEIVQLTYIQKWLREVKIIQINANREDDYWISEIIEFKSGNKHNRLCTYFNSYEEAIEAGINHELNKKP